MDSQDRTYHDDNRPERPSQAMGDVEGPGLEGALSALEWKGRAVGLLDLDAFFASVEQLDHPEWRGKPVIVGGSADKRGVVSTASYEARRYGVHSAMPSAEAARLCPNAIWTRGNFARYREMSDRVMRVLGDETPFVEQVSIDEAFFDVTPGRYSRESPAAICARIQRKVSDLGVTCSIGMGTSKTVAKIASERDKPRGLTVVPPGCEADFLAPLPVRSMSGIGAASEQRLLSLGVRTLGQLARMTDEAALQAMGQVGPMMVRRAAGLEQSDVAEACAEQAPKSVSNERTFSTDLTRSDEVRAALAHLSDMVAMRLMRRDLRGTTITVRVKYDYSHARSARRMLDEPTRDPKTILDTAWELAGTLWKPGVAVRLLGVGVSGFGSEPTGQMSLFGGDDDGIERRESLMAATERLRKRFGDDALAYGHDLRFRDATTGTAPMGKKDF